MGLRRVLAHHELRRYLGGSLFSPTITRRLIEQFAAITGGTGAYVGAAWTMTREGNGKRDTLTFTLE